VGQLYGVIRILKGWEGLKKTHSIWSWDEAFIQRKVFVEGGGVGGLEREGGNKLKRCLSHRRQRYKFKLKGKRR